MVAGTAPFSRIIFSKFNAVSKFCGNGRPWAITVDSSATTGLLLSSASTISGLKLIFIKEVGQALLSPAFRRPLDRAKKPAKAGTHNILFYKMPDAAESRVRDAAEKVAVGCSAVARPVNEHCPSNDQLARNKAP